MTGPFAKLSLKHSMVEEPGLILADQFRLVRDLGFDGIELDRPEPFSVSEILDACGTSGLLVPGIVNPHHWRLPLTDPDPQVRRAGIAAMVEALDLARDLGAETVLLVPGVLGSEVSYLEADRRAREGLRELLPHAHRAGVSIALENVWNGFLLSPLEAAGFIDSFADARLGWYFDVGNVLRYGWPEHWIEVLGPRIFRVDIKEFSRTRMAQEGLWKGFDVPLGQGDVDWSRVKRALGDAGYAGWASLEVPGGDRRRLADIRRQFERVQSA